MAENNENMGGLGTFLKAFGIITPEARRNVLIVVFVGMVTLIVFLFYALGRMSAKNDKLNDKIISMQKELYDRMINEVKSQVNRTVTPTVQKLDTVATTLDSATRELKQKINVKQK